MVLNLRSLLWCSKQWLLCLHWGIDCSIAYFRVWLWKGRKLLNFLTSTQELAVEPWICDVYLNPSLQRKSCLLCSLLQCENILPPAKPTLHPPAKLFSSTSTDIDFGLHLASSASWMNRITGRGKAWDIISLWSSPWFPSYRIVYSVPLCEKCWISTMGFSAVLLSFVWTNLASLKKTYSLDKSL